MDTGAPKLAQITNTYPYKNITLLDAVQRLPVLALTTLTLVVDMFNIL